MWDLSSPVRNRTYSPCNGSEESQPLDSQETPKTYLLNERMMLLNINVIFFFLVWEYLVFIS